MPDPIAIGTRLVEIDAAQGFDPVRRELTYVATTEAPVVAYRNIGGKAVLIEEVLKVDGCVNLASIDGTPLLNCHKRDDLRDVLGRQVRGWIEGDKLMGMSLVSDRADVRELDGDFINKIFNKVSTGYRLLKESIDFSLNPPRSTVTEWAWDETSVVPVPADMAAVIRAKAAQPVETKMAEKTLEEILAEAAKTFTTSIVTAVRAAAKPEPKADLAPEDDEETKAKKAKAAKAKKEEGDDDMGGDDSGGDNEERKRALADCRLIVGTRSAPAFDAAVRLRAPIPVLRQTAMEALRGAPGTRQQIPAPVVESTPAKASTFVSFSEFGALKAAKN